MGKLIYSMLESLDGYVSDAAGRFDWAMPDEQVHAFANELERTVGTYLYGRRMYEIMIAWETLGLDDGEPPIISEFAQAWRAADKVVYSTTLDAPSSARTRLERAFDPESIRTLKSESPRDISVSGPGLAAAAIGAGLVDHYAFFVFPVIVGGGTRTLPDGFRRDLELVEERRFDNGVVYVNYRASNT
ncbi:MAG: dihydrofolate reductase family protein [Coriobacteriia bacterium]|nr:dihydrofolate reductase family protein [Coriobacteriia bacterium]